jgi:hypothetical protein
MYDSRRARHHATVDPLDLRELHPPPERTASVFLLVWAPLIWLSLVALAALAVGLLGGASLAITLLIAGPTSLAGLFLTRLEPPRTQGHSIGQALMLSAAGLTVLLALSPFAFDL